MRQNSDMNYTQGVWEAPLSTQDTWCLWHRFKFLPCWRYFFCAVLTLLKILSVRTSYLVEDTFCAHFLPCWRYFSRAPRILLQTLSLCNFSYLVENATRIPHSDPQAASTLQYLTPDPQTNLPSKDFFGDDPQTIKPEKQKNPKHATNREPSRLSLFFSPKIPQSFRRIVWRWI